MTKTNSKIGTFLAAAAATLTFGASAFAGVGFSGSVPGVNLGESVSVSRPVSAVVFQLNGDPDCLVELNAAEATFLAEAYTLAGAGNYVYAQIGISSAGGSLTIHRSPTTGEIFTDRYTGAKTCQAETTTLTTNKLAAYLHAAVAP